MPTDLGSILFVLARILLGGAFLVFGIRNLNNLDRLSGVLSKKGLPQPRLLIMVGIAMQIVGGLAVATGILAAWGAAALIVFLIVAVYLFHDFWAYAGAERTPHLTAWIMNIGLSGAFLMVIATAI